MLRIEYPIPDYDAWKTTFDRDLLDREGSGVRRYRVLRTTDDPNYVMIDLDFDERARRKCTSTLFSMLCIRRGKHLQPQVAARRHASSRWWRAKSTDSGRQMLPYSPNLAEGVFCEVRLQDVA